MFAFTHYLTPACGCVCVTEEAMQEVKRQAVCELQKAVTAAEAKAIELVAIEKAKMERLLVENKKLAHEELLEALNKQEDCAEVCISSFAHTTLYCHCNARVPMYQNVCAWCVELLELYQCVRAWCLELLELWS